MYNILEDKTVSKAKNNARREAAKKLNDITRGQTYAQQGICFI